MARLRALLLLVALAAALDPNCKNFGLPFHLDEHTLNRFVRQPTLHVADDTPSILHNTSSDQVELPSSFYLTTAYTIRTRLTIGETSNRTLFSHPRELSTSRWQPAISTSLNRRQSAVSDSIVLQDKDGCTRRYEHLSCSVSGIECLLLLLQ
jgi:hypothetical protein